jgi:hypothetical protein
VQLARSVDVATSHTTAMGSWEVHSDVGLVSAGEDTLWGVLSLVVGGTGRGAVLGCFGYEWGGSGWVSSIFRPVTPTGSGFGWWHTGACGGWYLCVAAVLRFPPVLDRP